ncbi:MAG: PEF-CTERM sorting domain-containing protein [Candidatus Methanoperedens sp.]|nr:PEF-CTERM sorting domain-containing protein [Candidatus Methanoperedens sp.]
MERDEIYNAGRVGPYPTDLNGFYTGDLFNGIEDPHFESLNDGVLGGPSLWTPGQWTVALFHKGKKASASCDDITGLANSFKVDVPVDITIPEFPTVALPIAAVIGLVFFFQNRKKKEE